MRRHRVLLSLCLALILGRPDAFAAGGLSPGSTTYQIDPAHDGSITFSAPFAPPLKMKWSVDLGGPISYPVIDSGLVIVIAGGTIGTRLIALNIETGRIVWQKLIDGDFTTSYLASDSGMIFVTTFPGPLQAYKAINGKPLWSTQLPDELYFNFLPIAANGYVYTGGDESGTVLYQVSEARGYVGWTKLLNGGGLGPTLGNNQLYFPIPCEVPAFVPATGHVIWNYSTGCDGGGGAIGAYFGGRFYAPGVNIGGGVILAASNGKVVGGFTGNIPAFYGKIGYTISGASLIATQLGTGNLEWSFSPKDTLSNPPIAINGDIYTLSNTGKLYINNGRKGTLLQSFNIGLGAVTAPVSQPSTGLGAGQNMLIVPSGSILAAFAP